MTFDLPSILASKRAYRSRLAAQPVAEKLRLLDALREHTVVLRQAAVTLRGDDAWAQPGASEPTRDTDDSRGTTP